MVDNVHPTKNVVCLAERLAAEYAKNQREKINLKQRYLNQFMAK